MAEQYKDYDLTITSAADTGIRLAGVTQIDSDVVIYNAEFNPRFPVQETVAWAGGRTSRSDDGYEDIFGQIVDAMKVNDQFAAEKLARFFKDYGHASIAGMVPIFLFINKLPIHLALWIFNHISLGDGQELSTRFVELSDLGVMPLEKLVDLSSLSPEDQSLLLQEWREIQELAVQYYEKWYPRVSAALVEQFGPDIPKLTLRARTLDIVRMFIPSGAATSMALLASSRIWIDIIIQLREYDDPQAKDLAEHLFAALDVHKLQEEVLARKIAAGEIVEQPEPTAEMTKWQQIVETLRLSADPADLSLANKLQKAYDQEYHDTELPIQMHMEGLLKYADARGTVEQNSNELKEFLEFSPSFHNLLEATRTNPLYARESEVKMITINSLGLGMALQYIVNLYPQLSEDLILGWLEELGDDQKAQIGEIILRGHNQHDTMHNAGDVRAPVMFVLDTAFAYIRDLDRHRAFGRNISMVETDDMEAILNNGFNDVYQMREIPTLAVMREEFNADMADYQDRMRRHFADMMQQVPDANPNFIMRLVPLGQQVRMEMSAPIKQLVYMLYQRIAEGGDMGYRYVVTKMLELARSGDPFLRNLGNNIAIPDPLDREQFVSRR